MPEIQNQNLNSEIPKSSIFAKLNDFIIQLQGVSLSQKLFFTKNLGVMVKSGLSLSVAIKTLARQTSNKFFKKILDETHQTIEKGQMLSDALAAYPRYFSEIFINMIQVGEKSGNLEKVLEELTLQLKKTHELNSRVKGALAYPAFILAAMIGIGVLMLLFVIPQIVDIFSDINADLPLPTRILIALSNFFSHYTLWLALGLVVFLAALIKLIRTKTGKYYLHLILLKMPVINIIIKKINLAKFSRTFSTLMSTDIPIVKTLQITGGVLSNTHYKNYVIASAEQIKKGENVAKILAEKPDLFPPVVTQMIEVGEKTGTLNNILEDLAEFYEEEISNVMKGLASIIEPVLIIVLGAAVAAMAIAIIMPMYSITQSI